MSPRLLGISLAAVASLGLGACSTYDNYGYSGTRVAVGIGYGAPYYGWYDGYYYPGTGYYIYDRRGDRIRWSNRYRDYWMARRPHDRRYYDNWGGYNAPHRYRGMPRYAERRDYRDDRRVGRRDDRRDGRWDNDRRGGRWDGDRRGARDDRSRGRDDRRARGNDRRDRRGDRRRDRGPGETE